MSLEPVVKLCQQYSTVNSKMLITHLKKRTKLELDQSTSKRTEGTVESKNYTQVSKKNKIQSMNNQHEQCKSIIKIYEAAKSTRVGHTAASSTV